MSTTNLPPIALLESVQDGAAVIIAQVETDDHVKPTPCDGWDVAMLLDKMVTSPILLGTFCRGEKPAGDVNLLFPNPIGRHDPVGTYATAAADCLQAFTDSGLEGEMMGPLGVLVPKRAGLMVRSMDCMLNTWDLAGSIGVDHQIDEAQAAQVLEFVRGFLPKVRERTDHLRFGDPVETAAGSVVDQLVAESGRNPDWSAS